MFRTSLSWKGRGFVALAALAVGSPAAFASGGTPCQGGMQCANGAAVPFEAHRDSLLAMGGPANHELAVPRYDGSGGPLVGIDLQFEYSVDGVVCYTNLSRRDCMSVGWILNSFLVGLHSPDALLCDGFPFSHDLTFAGGWSDVAVGETVCEDFPADGACAMCPTLGPISVGPLTDPMNLASFSGAGLVRFQFATDILFSGFGCEVSEFTLETELEASVRVTYYVCSGSDLPPVCGPDVAMTVEGAPVAIAVLANDFDPEGQLVCESLTIVVPPSYGTVTIEGCMGFPCPACVVVYTPNAGTGGGIDAFVYEVSDAARQTTQGCEVQVIVEQGSEELICPDDAGIALWPPNHQYVDLDLAVLAGVVDPNGLPVAVVITGITQDESINGPGDGNTVCDGRGVGTNVASIRAERQGGGDGRVYHVSYDATNSDGDSCSGVFVVTVPHSQNGAPAVDSGQSVDSTQGC